jgi:hypothetical protein
VDELRARSPQEVFDDHLRLARTRAFEEDLYRNYAHEVVLLMGSGVHRGHDGVRGCWRLLNEVLPDATFQYHTRLVAGEMAFLEWTSQAEHTQVDDGADSFLIRDRRILAQTIHYTVRSRR